MIEYGFYKELDKSFNETAEVILKELPKHGFTIVTQIDMKDKFKEKLNKNFHQYTVLGLCHAPTAYEAIGLEKNIGLFLPCNMIVYENNEVTAVSVVKPSIVMNHMNNPGLVQLAEKLEIKLKQLFDSIK
jgi:uncharacterized protein (DUF302 family)